MVIDGALGHHHLGDPVLVKDLLQKANGDMTKVSVWLSEMGYPSAPSQLGD